MIGAMAVGISIWNCFTTNIENRIQMVNENITS